jgi:hypothetical protein
MNKITKMNVKINFTAASGYASQAGYKSDNANAGLDAIEELARILTISGNGSEVLDRVRAAVSETESSMAKP